MEDLMLDMIFFMPNDVMMALQLSLEDLWINGVASVDEENVSVVVHWVSEVSF